MGLFDFLKKKSISKSKSTISLTPEHKTLVPPKETVARFGVVSAKKVFWDSSTHALLQKKYIAFDVETTGLNSSTDRIIELGAVIFENGVPIKSFSSLVSYFLFVLYYSYRSE